MARRRKNVSSSWILGIGFYIVDGQGNIRTRTVTRGKGEDRCQVLEPIRFRTLNAAKDGLTLAGEDCAILCVTVDNFAWGE